MESGFRKEFPPPPPPFQAAPLSNLSAAFCTVANIALPPWAPDSISLPISRVLEVFIPSLAQHLCFCCSVGSLLAHGAHPQPLWAPLGHPHLCLAQPACGGVDCTNWRNCLGASIQGSSWSLVAQVPQGSPLWAPINLSGGAARSEAPAEIYVPQKCHRFWEHDLGMGSRAHTSCRLSFSFHSKW